jgi:hypothetical protein
VEAPFYVFTSLLDFFFFLKSYSSLDKKICSKAKVYFLKLKADKKWGHGCKALVVISGEKTTYKLMMYPKEEVLLIKLFFP